MLCVTCSAEYVRGALGNATEEIFENGLRCPMHPGGCEAMLEPQNLRTLVGKQSRVATRDEHQPITRAEHARLVRCANVGEGGGRTTAAPLLPPCFTTDSPLLHHCFTTASPLLSPSRLFPKVRERGQGRARVSLLLRQRGVRAAVRREYGRGAAARQAVRHVPVLQDEGLRRVQDPLARRAHVRRDQGKERQTHQYIGIHTRGPRDAPRSKLLNQRAPFALVGLMMFDRRPGVRGNGHA